MEKSISKKKLKSKQLIDRSPLKKFKYRDSSVLITRRSKNTKSKSRFSSRRNSLKTSESRNTLYDSPELSYKYKIDRRKSFYKKEIDLDTRKFGRWEDSYKSSDSQKVNKDYETSINKSIKGSIGNPSHLNMKYHAIYTKLTNKYQINDQHKMEYIAQQLITNNKNIQNYMKVRSMRHFYADDELEEGHLNFGETSRDLIKEYVVHKDDGDLIKARQQQVKQDKKKLTMQEEGELITKMLYKRKAKEYIYRSHQYPDANFLKDSIMRTNEFNENFKPARDKFSLPAI